MADPWSEFKPATPAKAAPVDPWAEFDDAPKAATKPSAAPGNVGRPTGQAHDGDTFRLSNGDNARLLGVDAFELNQTGRSPSGAVMPIGQDARARLLPFVQPGAVVNATGASTYGRPVVTLDNKGDAGTALLHDGLAIPQAQYLQADPQRLLDYVQAGRLARLNRRGAYQGSFQTPSSFRHGETPQRGSTEAIFFDEPTPNAGLPDSVAAGYEAVQRDTKATAADLIAYAKRNGFQINPADAERYMSRRSDPRYSTSIGTAYAPRAPRVLTDPGDGVTGAALRGVADPINMLDELGAVADTLLPNKERENVWSSGRRFGDVYANNLEQNRAILAYDDAQHPYARFGGQLAGGLITPGASIEGLGYRVASDVLRNGGTRFAAEQAARSAVVRRLGTAGAVEGALAGVGQGENARERFQGALIGGPAGLALGTLTGAAAPIVGKLVGKPFSRLAGREGEDAAQEFTDGALDSAKSRASNDIAGAEAVPAQAMSSERDIASMLGPDLTAVPRMADRIDAGDRPQQILANLANDQRLAEAARVRSRDMLPLPANTVDGVDEAARIEAGRYAPVRAPNEDATLSSQSLPSGTTGAPIRKRGPADLVTWL
jgi:endonuclease YncB( thermonuclease family)